MPGTMSTLDGLLKEDYGPRLRKMLPTVVPVLDMFETQEDVQWVGREHIEPIHVNRNRGGGAVSEGGPKVVAGNQQVEQLRIPCRYNTFPIELTEQVIQATRSDSGAFARAMRLEMNGILKDARLSRGFYLWGNGSGVRAFLNGALTTTAMTLDAPGGVAGATHGTRFLNAGDWVQFIVPETGALRGTTAYQISRNLAAGTGAVLTAAGTGTDNDYVVKVTMDGSSTITLPGTEWQKAQMGLLGMVDDGTYLSTYFGLSRLDFPHALNASVTASAGVLSADLLQRPIDTVDTVAGGKTGAIWSEHAARRAYLTITEADRRFVGGDLKSPDAGTAAAKTPTGKQGIFFGGIPWYTDPFCPYGMIFGLDTSSAYRFTMEPGSWADRSGAIWQTHATKENTWEAKYNIFDNFAILDPATCWRLDSVTVSVVVAHVV